MFLRSAVCCHLQATKRNNNANTVSARLQPVPDLQLPWETGLSSTSKEAPGVAAKSAPRGLEFVVFLTETKDPNFDAKQHSDLALPFTPQTEASTC